MNNKIRYKIHIPIVCGILLLQFFIADIFTAIFLQIVEKELKKSDGIFYKQGEYMPIREEESPKDYAFVFVSKSHNTITETYYTRKSERTRVTYVDGKWQGSDYITLSYFVFIAMPMIGFFLINISFFHKMARTGEVTTKALSSYPDDNFEKLCKFYGFPIFASAIIFGWLGRS